MSKHEAFKELNSDLKFIRSALTFRNGKQNSKILSHIYEILHYFPHKSDASKIKDADMSKNIVMVISE